MAELVVDSNVWVAYWLQRPTQFPAASQFVQELRQGQHFCHLPNLVLVEVCASVLREAPRQSLALPLLLYIRQTFHEWEGKGLIRFYELTLARASQAIDLNSSLPLHIKGADSIIASLSQELDMPLKTFDMEIQQRYPNATT